MADRTKKEWATTTWSPITGCTKISDGCKNCYAERMAKRLAGRFGYPADEPFRVTLHPDRLERPLKWKKPRRVFVCSMSDFFHPLVPLEFQAKVFRIVEQCPQHTFLFLTKRTEQLDLFNRVCGWPDLPNAWLGVTAENQEQADKRIPLLLQTPAAVRFVSCEPLLGPVLLKNAWLYYNCSTPGQESWDGLDWVIVGSESGPRRRFMALDWARMLAAQCATANVPVFIKQLPINVKVSHEPSEWPEDLRIREYPA